MTQTTTIKTSSLTSADPTLSLPNEIQLDADGTATACHADSGDVAYANLGELCEAYQIDQDEVEALIAAAQFAALTEENGSVEHDGKTLALEQQAYFDSDPRDTSRVVYRAAARDQAGNVYRVLWALRPEIEALAPEQRPEDESAYCDWDAPESVELIEAA